ncbi:MAG TPA: hypothetical protein VHR18_10570 [Solirubrobacterales bacterium]|jgi:hypothetical protein|nr:hypothetical protein [Solirubrobacterales bacterium]
MLARSSYDKAYIDGVRQRIKAQVATFETLAGAAGGEDAQPVADFAPLFFGHLTIALDGYFLHRTRGKEAKKGPLKDLRALAEAVAEEGIAVSRQEFSALASASLAELEERFTG